MTRDSTKRTIDIIGYYIFVPFNAIQQNQAFHLWRSPWVIFHDICLKSRILSAMIQKNKWQTTPIFHTFSKRALLNSSISSPPKKQQHDLNYLGRSIQPHITKSPPSAPFLLPHRRCWVRPGDEASLPPAANARTLQSCRCLSGGGFERMWGPVDLELWRLKTRENVKQGSFCRNMGAAACYCKQRLRKTRRTTDLLM